MAVSGSGGWIPSNKAKIQQGNIVFIAITQNKPRDIIHDLDTAVDLLMAGELATVDVRETYMTELRRRVAIAQMDRLNQG